MKAEEFIDKLFELLGEMHDDLQEHKCQAVEEYNRQITKLFGQSAIVKRVLLDHDKTVTGGMKIDPPPKEDSREPLFRVVYSIDINARDAHQAAENAYRLMSDCTSMPPVLYVMNSRGTEKRIDLAEQKPGRQAHRHTNDHAALAKSSGDQRGSIFTKITIGFVAQTFEKNDKGKFVCTMQEFVASDQVDYEDQDGNPITPPEHPYQQFNMSL